MPENDNKKIWDAIRRLEYRLNTHKHLQSDLTAALNVDGTAIYTGFVNSGGTAGTPFPEEWTVSRPNTGEYTITHNLGTTAYTVIACPVNNSHVFSVTRSSNSVTVVFDLNVSPFSATNGDFYFVLAKE